MYVFISHASADGHLAQLHSLATVKAAAINMNVQVSLEQVIESVGYIPNSGIAG